ncbi:MAG: 23S rRNA (pseudouridine(1915)-N(3))-methyltransferase RlmH [Alphaproteobacteria bacterium]|nr:23S rRNA (pseudouridine(1915)-N(3))-methyltransferase RlmH [Alphaproteobacteria bacterium]
MKIIIAAIGKLNKKSPEQVLIDDYISKSKWPVTVVQVEEKKALRGPELQAAEGELLLKQIPPDFKIVALDERGEEPSSRAFAEKLGRWRDMGTTGVAFLIGGADGHTNTTRQRADYLLSFGRMTLPHFLARVVLSEQIYRVQTILSGHPYHRD